MLRKILLIIPLAINSACLSSLPKPPKGDLCVLDVPNAEGICVHISRVAELERLDKEDANNIIPLDQMDDWVTFSPKTWKNIQVYINELKELIQIQCQ